MWDEECGMRNEKRAANSCSFCCIVRVTKMGIIGRMGLMGRISLMGLMGRMGLMGVINGCKRALRKPTKKTSRPFDGASLP